MSSEGGKKQFWKRNVSKVPGSIQHVYGAQHPPFDPLLHANLLKANSKSQSVSMRTKKVTSFQEFESITSDAWDVGDDDDELLAMAAQNLNTDVVMETANKVLQIHSKLQEQKQQDKQIETSPEQLDRLEQVNNKTDITRSTSAVELNRSGLDDFENTSLPRQQSVPSRSTIPLVARIADQNTSDAPLMTEREMFRLEKFRQLLAGPNTDLEELRKFSWSGIPRQVRPITWKLLSGYLPANAERRESTLQRKRAEYFAFIEHYYDSRNDEHHQDTYRQGQKMEKCFRQLFPETTVFLNHQIAIDIPRMTPESLILQPKVREIFERILFIWAIRHPASGYVQGINDLVTPFFVVFVFEYIEGEVENFDVSSLPDEVLQNIEADSFWCMSKLLDGIQDNYTFAQPGIQKKVKALQELVSRIDEQVHKHLKQSEVEYLQFAFRWMNNLLMRELPLRCTIRLWDTYQSEPDGFSHFHLYVCAAFLVKWRKEILEEKDFQGLMILLQNLPTMHWGNEEISVLLAESYRLKYAFADAPNHYKR
ncbi:TBC1 domain family member 22A isoform X4 [Scyliorhinus canicula]|uniref:TBC1 domain family member 22A isoform X4 n=1 Tax=Scyliorhinus canicula TaxID=7830 RepID=UPI0018F40063|nr:TBC1 domain family member 22A isoform X4 [Scyliorhinus canicula]